jgi:FkbM family methyltransferase
MRFSAILLVRAEKGTRGAMLRYILQALRVYVGMHPAPREYRVRLDGLTFTVEANRGDLAPYPGIFINREYAHDPRFVPPAGGIVVDVGAQVGFFAAYASRCVGTGRVYSFEPDPTSFARLQTNVEANQLSNVHLHHVAVGDTCAPVLFECWPLSVDSRVTTKPSARTIEVPCTTLDEFVTTAGLERIDLLKVDTEGFEVHVLRGAAQVALPRTQRIVIEIHSPKLHEEVDAILRPAGFAQVAECNNVCYYTRS